MIKGNTANTGKQTSCFLIWYTEKDKAALLYYLGWEQNSNNKNNKPHNLNLFIRISYCIPSEGNFTNCHVLCKRYQGKTTWRNQRDCVRMDIKERWEINVICATLYGSGLKRLDIKEKNRMLEISRMAVHCLTLVFPNMPEVFSNTVKKMNM